MKFSTAGKQSFLRSYFPQNQSYTKHNSKDYIKNKRWQKEKTAIFFVYSMKTLNFVSLRRNAGVVDRAALEMRCTGNCTEGSNPPFSAEKEASNRYWVACFFFHTFPSLRTSTARRLFMLLSYSHPLTLPFTETKRLEIFGTDVPIAIVRIYFARDPTRHHAANP